MTWLGKLVGGSIGFAMGGPLGAVLGATLGHAFDSSTVFHHKMKIDTNDQYLYSEEQSQITFFVAVFSMLAKLAKADGKVSREEINYVEKFISEDLKLSGSSKSFAINIFRTALNSPQPFDAFAKQFYDQFQNQPQMLEFMLDIMLRVAIADGDISQKEESFLIQTSYLFKLGQTKYNRLKSRYVINNIGKYYSILGCKITDREESIKKCYRQKVQEYHPDKIAAKGLPDEFTQFAQDKFREIQEAWEHIKKDRGFK